MIGVPIMDARPPRQRNCSEIIPRLYLGDLVTACCQEEMMRLGITHMITIEIKPIDPVDRAPTIEHYEFINVMDHSKQDIMSHFDRSTKIIEDALRLPNNKVYVHCVAGISRSASLVIAYIMKTRQMSFAQAHRIVKEKRYCIEPNAGFRRQLELYQEMNYSINIGDIRYRKVVLDALLFEFRLIRLSLMVSYQTIKDPKKPGKGPAMVQVPTRMNKIVSDPSDVGVYFEDYYNKLKLQEVSNFPQVYDPKTAYKCRKCRATVFYPISVIQWSYAQGNIDPTDVPLEEKALGQRCPYIYIEPQPWMTKISQSRNGNLECYMCKRKLGKFEWNSTADWSCNCPAHRQNQEFNVFRIVKKKVDALLLTPGMQI